MSSLDDMPELVGSDDDMPELVESDHDDPPPPVANYAAQLIRRFGAPLGFFVRQHSMRSGRRPRQHKLSMNINPAE